MGHTNAFEVPGRSVHHCSLKDLISMILPKHTHVVIAPTRTLMGSAAAHHLEQCIREVLKTKETANIIFAAAPSQNEFLESLTQSGNIDWSRLVGLHMDEYFSLPPGARQLFGVYLAEHLFSKVPFRKVYYLDGQATNIAAECRRYSDILKDHPVDIVCMGIGENGHIAFNDPAVADFSDPELVKVAVLDEICRQQQVNDGCFQTLSEVPVQALTLTIPALMSAKFLIVVVPSRRKANAVFRALTGPVTTEVPASILQTHDQVEVFLDTESASLLSEGNDLLRGK